MNNSIHSIDYKGVTIHCENGLYWIHDHPTRKYFSMADCQKEVDKVAKTLEDNIQNLRELVNRKARL